MQPKNYAKLHYTAIELTTPIQHQEFLLLKFTVTTKYAIPSIGLDLKSTPLINQPLQTFHLHQLFFHCH